MWLSNGMVVQWLELYPHSKKVVSSILTNCLSVWSLLILPVCARVFLLVLCLLSSSKDMHVKNVNACLCQTGNLSTCVRQLEIGNPERRISSDRNGWQTSYQATMMDIRK